MRTKRDDGSTWGRPEALDTLGRRPGRWGQLIATGVGLSAVVTGGYIALGIPAGGLVPLGQLTPSTIKPAAAGTCASIGVTLLPNRIPAEGVAPDQVVQLSRTNADGSARVLVPQAYVLRVAKAPDGGLQVSVLVRTEANGGDTVNQINSANSDQSLIAAVLYDVDAPAAKEECRRRR
jgi:hypothetical protein